MATLTLLMLINYKSYSKGKTKFRKGAINDSYLLARL